MLGEIVPDNLRAEAQAKYLQQINDSEEYKQINIDTGPIFEECSDMKAGHITVEELNLAINRFNNKKTPGPDGLPSEHKWLNGDST